MHNRAYGALICIIEMVIYIIIYFSDLYIYSTGNIIIIYKWNLLTTTKKCVYVYIYTEKKLYKHTHKIIMNIGRP